MMQRRRRWATSSATIPLSRAIAMSIGGGGSALNTGRMFITLKPRDQRKRSADQIIARLRPKLAKVEGARLFLQAAQDVSIGGRIARTQFQYTLQDADLAELNDWAPKMLEKLKTLPELRDVATDQQIAGTAADAHHRPRQAVALRHHAATDRRHALRRFRSAPGGTILHPAEQLPRHNGDPAAAAGRAGSLTRSTSSRRPPASRCRWRRFVQVDDANAPLSISHQGQFPAVTLSFNLAQGVALGTAVEAIHRAEREIRRRPSLHGTFQGNAQAFQESLRTVPLSDRWRRCSSSNRSSACSTRATSTR